MKNFLVETALLGHGLPSIENSTLQNDPVLAGAPLVWLKDGVPVLSTLKDFLPLRSQANALPRVSRRSLASARQKGLTAFLTASAVIQICAEKEFPLAVTAGMGGIGPRPAATVGEDLLALAELPVSLIAAAPKDVFDHPATFAWLHSSGVPVRSTGRPFSDGFLCQSPPVSLVETDAKGSAFLLLHPVPASGRCISTAQLAAAMSKGTAAAENGCEYHPAVNAELDRLSGSLSSRWQLSSLCANITLAHQL